ncbi:MAG: zinc-ribbon domain-containing protein [Deltaproteobacteria bacterium]|nr:zinc-ribbon domain-containing protein [Deltaproteobacteria bacterium]
MAFCPSCGTQNADTAAACSSCGAAMGGGGGGGGGGQKFKGTILMGGPSSADVEALVAKAKAAAQAPRTPAAGAPPMPQGGLAFQATMLSPTAGSDAFPHPLGAEAPAAPEAPAIDSSVLDNPLRPSAVDGATLREAPDQVSLDFSGDDMALPKSGKGAMVIVLVIVGLLLIGGIATGVVLYLRSRAAVPQYQIPGYPAVPGQVPGQVPAPGFPGQFPGAPGAFPQVPPGVPGLPGVPPALPAPPPPAQ